MATTQIYMEDGVCHINHFTHKYDLKDHDAFEVNLHHPDLYAPTRWQLNTGRVWDQDDNTHPYATVQFQLGGALGSIPIILQCDDALAIKLKAWMLSPATDTEKVNMIFSEVMTLLGTNPVHLAKIMDHMVMRGHLQGRNEVRYKLNALMEIER